MFVGDTLRVSLRHFASAMAAAGSVASAAAFNLVVSCSELICEGVGL